MFACLQIKSSLLPHLLGTPPTEGYLVVGGSSTVGGGGGGGYVCLVRLSRSCSSSPVGLATRHLLRSSHWQHKMPRYFFLPLLLLLLAPFCSSSAFNAHLAAGTNETQHLLVRSGEPDPLTTCGYLDGNPTHYRTANSGYNCRFDTANSLWGFCPTTVIQAVDCGLAGACIDQHDCTKGCGNLQGKLTTFTWLV